MKISLNWLKGYVDIVLPADKLAERLTMSGNEVSNIETTGRDWDMIIVGQILALNRHPNAERLQLATVDIGSEQITVVCGAFNIKVGDKVPFAPVGTTLFDGHTGKKVQLKPAKIRGIVSEGMICSEKELGISNNHEGILILSSDAIAGMALTDFMGDTIFDFKLTPNRSDCLSVIGIAREVATLTGQKITVPDIHYDQTGDDIHKYISVEISDPELCSRYSASLITDVKIKPSPHWMQQRLIASGMRPINNIVDITNYVMLEYGQPLHAFDYEKIKKRIIVRRGKNEELTTIDGTVREVTEDTLVIADDEKPIAIAGVMGGTSSEITENTSIILLESANFNRESIRRTAARLKMRSEASLRFEKGLSPELTLHGLMRATQLIVDFANAKAAKGVIDIYPGNVKKEPILLTLQKVKQIFGQDIERDKIVTLLQSLGFHCEVQKSSQGILVTVPYWRTDVSLAVDLIEELARIIGYDQLPATILSGEIPQPQPHPLLKLKYQIRDILIGCGMQEVITYPLISRNMIDKVSAQEPIRIANPLSTEHEYLRTTLRSSLLANVAKNEKNEESIKLFEIGKIYVPRRDDLPIERELLCGIITGTRFERGWCNSTDHLDFYDAKGILEILFNRLGIHANFDIGSDVLLASGRTAGITIDSIEVGILGEIDRRVAESFDISSDVAYLFEINLEQLLPFNNKVQAYVPLSRFPGIIRDISLLVDITIPSKKVQDIIQEFSLVHKVSLFDVYSGNKIPEHKKTLAYSILFQSESRTLTDDAVNKVLQNILKKLELELGATLRQ